MTTKKTRAGTLHPAPTGPTVEMTTKKTRAGTLHPALTGSGYMGQ